MGAREGGYQGRGCTGRSFCCARPQLYLGTTGEIARASACASLLSLTPPTGMPALPDPPQHTQRRDPSLTSTCRRSWSARPARDVGWQCREASREAQGKMADHDVRSGASCACDWQPAMRARQSCRTNDRSRPTARRTSSGCARGSLASSKPCPRASLLHRAPIDERSRVDARALGRERFLES